MMKEKREVQAPQQDCNDASRRICRCLRASTYVTVLSTGTLASSTGSRVVLAS